MGVSVDSSPSVFLRLENEAYNFIQTFKVE